MLDVLLRRTPWVAEASRLWQLNDDGKLQAYLTATSLTDIFYVTRRICDQNTALVAVYTCLEAFEICPVDRDVLEQAVDMPGTDFEDNLQVACAIARGLNAIVTRDPRGFAGSSVEVLTPQVALDRLDRAEDESPR